MICYIHNTTLDSGAEIIVDITKLLHALKSEPLWAVFYIVIFFNTNTRTSSYKLSCQFCDTGRFKVTDSQII
jgi:hypothetical protein